MDIVKRMRRRNDLSVFDRRSSRSGWSRMDQEVVPAAGRGVDVWQVKWPGRVLASVRGASLVEEAEIKRLRASGGCLGTERR